MNVYGGILPPGYLPPPRTERYRPNAETWGKVYVWERGDETAA